jgi:hypothetical protein
MNVEIIANEVARVFKPAGVSVDNIKSKSRWKEIVFARHMTIRLSVKYLREMKAKNNRASFIDIGKKIGNRERTTIYHSIIIADDMYFTSSSWRKIYDALNLKINSIIEKWDCQIPDLSRDVLELTKLSQTRKSLSKSRKIDFIEKMYAKVG